MNPADATPAPAGSGSRSAQAYRPDIDGLRAVAVMAVFLHHLAPRIVPGGFVGVDVFFVISGYLITRILRTEIEQGRFSFAAFYERRMRRIFPALFTVLAATLLVAHAVLLPSDLVSTLKGALGTVLFSSNIVFWREMGKGYFAATDAGLNPLLHTWSLGVEEQYYVLFPIVLLLLARGGRARVVSALVLTASLSLVAAGLLVSTKAVAVFFLSPFRAWELLAGSLLAYEAVPRITRAWARDAVGVAGLGAILASCFLYSPSTPFPGWTALLPVLGSAAIIHAGASGSNIGGWLLGRLPIVYIGRISYSLYLWHWPVIVLTRYVHALEPASEHFAFITVLSFLLAALSYHFVEQPFRRPRSFSRRTIFAISTAGMFAAGSVAATGWMQGGYPGRFSPEVVTLDQERSPAIPFLECDGQSLGHACMLGAPRLPHILLWGDSHLLALAPAFDKLLRDSGESAVLATTSACAPFLTTAFTPKEERCRSHNQGVRAYLQAHPEADTVVIVAFWSLYAAPDSQEYLSGGAGRMSSELRDTVQWLRHHGRRVILFGPLPTYDQAVPFLLAEERRTGVPLLHRTIAMERARNAPMRQLIDAQAAEGVTIVDPTSWLCEPECIQFAGGESLYRDSNHLSVPGALYVAPKIRSALGLPAAAGPSATVPGLPAGSTQRP